MNDMGTNDSSRTSGSKVFSVRNGLFALLIVVLAAGAYFATRYSSLSTFLGGITRDEIFAVGDRHIAILVNGATLKAGESAGSSLYIENLADTKQAEHLCNISIDMTYDPSIVSIENLEKSPSVPGAFETFDVRNDAQKGKVVVDAESAQCNASFNEEVMELVTFTLRAKQNAPLGFSPLQVNDSSHVVDVRKKDVTALNGETQNGVYVYDVVQQEVTSATPSVVSQNTSTEIVVKGSNIYVLDSIRNVDTNTASQQVYYFEKGRPGYHEARGTLPDNVPSGSYLICARTLFGTFDDNVCSTTPLLRVE